jgi:ABC-type glycerol-3-phosphate transport system permease component
MRSRLSITSQFALFKLVVAVLSASIVLLSLAPLLWAFSTSLKTPREIFAFPPNFLPPVVTGENYARLIADHFQTFAFNSLFYTTITVVGTSFFGSLAAYALARINFKGKSALVLLFLFTLITPYMAVLVPLFFMLSMLGLLDSRLTLPVVYISQAIPFAAWFFKGYFEMIPDSMERAALVDGYSRVEALYKILLPVAMPGFVSVAVFTALTSWNDYIVAIFLLSSSEFQTLPVAMFYYLGTHGREWGPLTAAVVVGIVPIITLFLVFRKFFLGGLISGAIKG